MSNRRRFLATFPALFAAPTLLTGNTTTLPLGKPFRSVNDQINLACIGMGIQGFNDVNAALKTTGVKLVAVCDLYDGHLERAKEVYGQDLFTTQDFNDILRRPDIDAVIVATPDHWHDDITVAALNAGKHVYCEKPLVQDLEEGRAVLDAEAKNNAVLMVGSQRVSSILTEKAREIYQSGQLGDLVMVEAYIDRFSPMGAWQYSIPRDASAATVGWETFLKDTKKLPFDATRFFRWRNYRDYGTGVGGDLFVHLFSGVHRILDSVGPNRVFATGGLRYWDDGRDVPDVFIASCDYGKQPGHAAFNMQLRINFVAGGGTGDFTRLVGTEGSLEMGWGSLTLKRNKLPAAPGFGGWDTYNTFTKKQQAEFERWYQETYPPAPATVVGPDEWTYRTPEGYSAHAHHFNNWFTAIRTGGKVVEDGAFGFRAAAPSLLANESYFGKKVMEWEPEGMRVK